MDKAYVNNKVTVATLLVALGIIYGDIGTSPLYVLSAVVSERKIDEIEKCDLGVVLLLCYFVGLIRLFE